MAGFGQLARASMTDGAISAKNKELIALAIGITQRCSGCIGFHVKALHNWDAAVLNWKKCWRCAFTWVEARHSCTPQKPSRHGNTGLVGCCETQLPLAVASAVAVGKTCPACWSAW